MAVHTAGASRSAQGEPTHNVAQPERIASVALGAALVAYGLRRRNPGGIAAALIGGAFIHRGATGNCPVYSALGIGTGDAEAVLDSPRRRGLSGHAATVNARDAIKVERARHHRGAARGALRHLGEGDPREVMPPP